MINLCCFKSRSSSSFVTAVIRKVMCHPLTLPDMSACHRRVRATEPLAHQRDRLLPPANSSSRGGVHTQHRGTQLLFHTFPCNTLTLHSWSSFGLRDLCSSLFSDIYQGAETDKNNNNSPFTGLLWGSNKQPRKAPSPVPGTFRNVP